MKIRIFIITAVFVFILSGCGGTKQTAVSFRGISFTAKITYLNENYTADCTIDDSGDFKATMLTPESIKGLELSVIGGKSKLCYNGIEISEAERFMPQSSSVMLLVNALKKCENTYSSGESGNTKLRGEVNSHEYILICSPTGLPISLSVADYGMTVVFKSLKYV